MGGKALARVLRRLVQRHGTLAAGLRLLDLGSLVDLSVDIFERPLLLEGAVRVGVRGSDGLASHIVLWTSGPRAVSCLSSALSEPKRQRREVVVAACVSFLGLSVDRSRT